MFGDNGRARRPRPGQAMAPTPTVRDRSGLNRRTDAHAGEALNIPLHIVISLSALRRDGCTLFLMLETTSVAHFVRRSGPKERWEIWGHFDIKRWYRRYFRIGCRFAVVVAAPSATCTGLLNEAQRTPDLRCFGPELVRLAVLVDLLAGFGT